MKIKKALLLINFFFISALIRSQAIEWNSSQIYHEIEKLKNTGTVLYLAAHPDDENTRLIAWLSNEAKVRTVYLSLTRGDGGQNLIGTEKGNLLGVIRTQELLEARKIDGGEQLFTRAVDFGYSKTWQETFDKWDKKKILEDVVFAIREIQPDIIITRFPPDKSAGHGHHQASAILAEEAFKMAANKDAFPSQFEFVQPWQTKSLLHNSSHWFNKNLEQEAKNSSSYIKIDVGMFNPLLGESYNTIATKARSQHKCQGFGTILERGSQFEYLKHVKGIAPDKDIFNNFNFSWDNAGGKSDIEQGIDFILDNFDFQNPSSSIPNLIALYDFIDQIPSKKKIVHYKKEKLLQIIEACAGLWYEANSNLAFVNQRQKFIVDLSVLQRSSLNIELTSVTWNNKDSLLEKHLSNQKRDFPIDYQIAINKNYSSPFWLNGKTSDSFEIHDPTIRNAPENRNKEKVTFHFKVSHDKKEFSFSRTCNIMYKWEDKVKGELKKDLCIVPKYTLEALDKNVIFKNSESKKIRVKVIAHSELKKGLLKPKDIPSGWVLEPSEIEFDLNQNERVFEFNVIPTSGNYKGKIKFEIESENKIYSDEIFIVEYDHISSQIVIQQCETKVTSIDLNTVRKSIGYIPGSGDEIPNALTEMGYSVEYIQPKEILEAHLEHYECIVVGIRAFNLDNGLSDGYNALMNYVEKGGHLLLQYNTNRNLKIEELGPYPFNLSSLRVTQEQAKVKFNSEFPIFQFPNSITEEDFKNWVQERGLYFADDWDSNYQTLFEMSDTDSEMLAGSTLLCRYGKGSFLYTGISFFRQLDAGVPGAFRLFSNFIEYSPTKNKNEND